MRDQRVFTDGSRSLSFVEIPITAANIRPDTRETGAESKYAGDVTVTAFFTGSAAVHGLLRV